MVHSSSSFTHRELLGRLHFRCSLTYGQHFSYPPPVRFKAQGNLSIFVLLNNLPERRRTRNCCWCCAQMGPSGKVQIMRLLELSPWPFERNKFLILSHPALSCCVWAAESNKLSFSVKSMPTSTLGYGEIMKILRCVSLRCDVIILNPRRNSL